MLSAPPSGFGAEPGPETRLMAANALSVLDSWEGAIATSAPWLCLWRLHTRSGTRILVGGGSELNVEGLASALCVSYEMLF